MAHSRRSAPTLQFSSLLRPSRAFASMSDPGKDARYEAKPVAPEDSAPPPPPQPNFKKPTRFQLISARLQLTLRNAYLDLRDDYLNYLHKRWYNKYLFWILVLLFLVGAIIMWDQVLSPSSPSGVIRRSWRFLKSQPEMAEMIGEWPRWYTSGLYGHEYHFPVPSYIEVISKSTGRPKLWVAFFVKGTEGRGVVHVIAHKNESGRYEGSAIFMDIESYDSIAYRRGEKPLF